MAMTTPIITHSENVGEDWYCSDHEAHVKYEKHLKRHLGACPRIGILFKIEAFT